VTPFEEKTGWVAGISIGSVNAAIIAGNPPGERVRRLRQFWETVSSRLLGWPLGKTTTRGECSTK
jgi:NTE family protein